MMDTVNPQPEDTEDLPEHVQEMELPQTETFTAPTKKPHKKIGLIILALVILLGGATAAYEILNGGKKPTVGGAPANISSKKTIPADTSNVPGLQLDANKNYGNKYANGVLPVGDNMYVSDAAKAGYVFACAGYANNLKQGQGGAGSRGPWFVGTTQYDLNKKAHVAGAVKWQAQFTNTVSGASRNIVTNDLPSHTTGVFPISASDPAYAYDRNPNSIKGQSFSYALSSAPSYGTPNCIGGQVGIMLSGVALFDGFDAGGRDAGAWEVQDSCGGHPEKTGTYHYHTLSSCITDISVKTVIGFALDGFPITGPQVAAGNILTTSDLDECHGLSSQIILDGKNVTSYHYVMSQDFPYSISCYRATAIQPPGQPVAKP